VFAINSKKFFLADIMGVVLF